MEQAEASVDLAVYDLNLPPVADALLGAHRRGVDVRVVTGSDNAHREAVRTLQAAGIPVVEDQSDEGLMHNKFAVIDDQTVILLLIIPLAAALALVCALSLGLNDPRPSRPPDWTAPGVPHRLDALPDAAAVSLLDRSASDFTFEVLARPVDAPESGFYGVGLVYRTQDPGRYYAFAVGGDGYYAVLRVDEGEEMPLVPWQQFPHVRRGSRENRLRVTCAGASCDFTINDEFAATVEDGTWLSGEVGLWARAFQGPVAVEFSSARLWTSDRAQ
ncbi:MAG: phospholipase D-like domain-containing protein [Chloroflexota bacterium]